MCLTNISSSLRLKVSTTELSLAVRPTSIQENNSAQITAGSILSNKARAELKTAGSGFANTASIRDVNTPGTTGPPTSHLSNNAREILLTLIGSGDKPSCATRSFFRADVSGCRAYLAKKSGLESGPSSQVYKRRFKDTSLRRTTVIALKTRRSRSSAELRVRKYG